MLIEAVVENRGCGSAGPVDHILLWVFVQFVGKN